MSAPEGPPVVREIETRSGRVWYDEAHNIVRFQTRPHHEQTLDDAKENVRASASILAGRRYPFLVDITKVKPLKPEVRAYYGSDEARLIFRAIAIFVTSFAGRMLGNIFLSINGKGDVPIRLFTSEAEAIQWLQGFPRDHDRRADP